MPRQCRHFLFVETMSKHSPELKGVTTTQSVMSRNGNHDSMDIDVQALPRVQESQKDTVCYIWECQSWLHGHLPRLCRHSLFMDIDVKALSRVQESQEDTVCYIWEWQSWLRGHLPRQCRHSFFMEMMSTDCPEFTRVKKRQSVISGTGQSLMLVSKRTVVAVPSSWK